MKLNRNNLSQRGFGLLEVLVSIFILALVGSSTWYFWHEQKLASSNAPDIKRSLLLAKSKVDSLQSGKYQSLSAGSDTVGNRYIRRWYVTTDLQTDKKTVEMLVSWPLTAQHTISFSTVVGNDRYKIF